MSESTSLSSALSPGQIRVLVEKDHKYLWHPFTPMKEWAAQDCLIITGGDGAYLIDAQGNRYLDGVSSLWVNLHGHRRKEIDEAVRDQLDRIAHSTLLGLSHAPAIELAERLARLAPGALERVFYSDSGSTAVEAALKIAFQYWQQHPDKARHAKRRIVSFHNAYHGDTLGAVSVGGMDLFHACYQPLLFPSLKAHYPYCYRCHLGRSHPGCRLACLEELEDLLERQAHTVAALIIEPLVQGAAGMITAPEGFLRGVETLCRKYEVLLIADEVAMGWGRTGTLFAVEREGVEPDLMALAKGITGGYLPLAATLATETIYEGFLGEPEEGKTFFHGHTYTGNPLAARAALAALDLFEKDRTLETLPDKIRCLEQGLRPLRALDHVGDVRQCGFLAGIELVEDRDTRRPFPAGKRVGMRVAMEARRHGLILRPLGDVMVIMPPLILSLEEIDRMMEITCTCIREITESGE
jgi:adenosylmethionine---8-amino-7-oxononanoate aminotransferase